MLFRLPCDNRLFSLLPLCIKGPDEHDGPARAGPAATCVLTRCAREVLLSSRVSVDSHPPGCSWVSGPVHTCTRPCACPFSTVLTFQSWPAHPEPAGQGGRSLPRTSALNAPSRSSRRERRGSGPRGAGMSMVAITPPFLPRKQPAVKDKRLGHSLVHLARVWVRWSVSEQIRVKKGIVPGCRAAWVSAVLHA